MFAALAEFTAERLNRWLSIARHRGWIGLEPRDGLRIRSEELDYVFSTNDAVHLRPTEAKGERDGWSYFLQAVEEGLSQGDPVAERWWSLSHRLSLSPDAQQLLALLVTAAGSTQLSRAFRYAWADFGRRTLSVGFASLLLAVDGAPTSLLDGRGAAAVEELKRYCLVRLEVESDTPAADTGIQLPSDVVAWLCGWPREWPEMLDGDALPAASPRLRQGLAPKLRQFLASATRRAPLVVVSGPLGSGRLGVAAELAVAWGVRGLWRLDLRPTGPQSAAQLERKLQRGVSLSTLAGLALAIVAVPSTEVDRRPEEAALWESLLDQAAEAEVPCVWMTSDPSFAPQDRAAMVLRIPFPNRSQRVEAWRTQLGDSLVSEDLEALAGRFLIAEGAIAQAAREARASLPPTAESAELRDAVAESARRLASVGLGSLAQPETSSVRLSDVILGQESRTLIEEIASYARHRHRLAKEWGFAEQRSYGLGVTALFAGPPGTGKTLAATAIARELGHELYRVDLSQMVSKYIGETEKHLATVFDAAEQGEVMLLFDEADSLFGKRTQVKSSVDRYANLEVNYLLQRIERFDGLVILTTNFEAGLDDAFARRIRFRVAFPQPDEQGRRALWRALLPSAVPRLDLDLDALATTYELSGGHIKEIVLRAASLAMDDGGVLTQTLLVRSADAEYRKLGKLPVDSSSAATRRRDFPISDQGRGR